MEIHTSPGSTDLVTVYSLVHLKSCNEIPGQFYKGKREERLGLSGGVLP